MVKLFLTTRWRYHLMKMILFGRLEASGYFWDRVCTVKETSLWIYGGKAIFYRLHSDLTETFKGTGNSRRDGTVSVVVMLIALAYSSCIGHSNKAFEPFRASLEEPFQECGKSWNMHRGLGFGEVGGYWWSWWIISWAETQGGSIGKVETSKVIWGSSNCFVFPKFLLMRKRISPFII